MQRFASVFTGWFLAGLSFFALANLIGAPREFGTREVRTPGFPFSVTTFLGEEALFDWSALARNAAVAVSASLLVGLLCAASRCIPGTEPGPARSAAEELLAQAARLDRSG
jgi:hypothetical protein